MADIHASPNNQHPISGSPQQTDRNPSLLLFQVVDNPLRFQWKEDNDGPYKEIPSDGLATHYTTSKTVPILRVNVHNRSSCPNLQVSIGKAVNQPIPAPGGSDHHVTFDLEVPAHNGHVNDFKLGVFCPATGERHDPTFYIKRDKGG